MTTTDTMTLIKPSDSPLGAWLHATTGLAREWFEEEYEVALDAIMKAREGRVKVNHKTETQRAKARAIAKAKVNDRLYELAEAPDGTPNPYRLDGDFGWAYGAT